jgi:solute carrier family 25 oxoglutarate transporter 11
MLLFNEGNLYFLLTHIILYCVFSSLLPLQHCLPSEAKSIMTSIMQTAQPFVCGGSAAMFASSIVHPVDLAKVRLQLFAVQNPGEIRPSFPKLIVGMIKKDGIMSIYSGISASLMRQCVYGTARIGLFRTFSDHFIARNDGKPLNFLMKAFSGMSSGSIAVWLVNS